MSVQAALSDKTARNESQSSHNNGCPSEKGNIRICHARGIVRGRAFSRLPVTMRKKWRQHENKMTGLNGLGYVVDVVRRRLKEL